MGHVNDNQLGVWAMYIFIFILTNIRMITIYLKISLAPIPMATMANKEWSSIGVNYLKGLFALALQGFLMLVCIAIYAAMIQGMTKSGNIQSIAWMTLAFTILLCVMLFKTGSIANSILGVH